jgi:hypothetical protein
MTISGVGDWLRLVAAFLFLVAVILSWLGWRRPGSPPAYGNWWPTFVAGGLFFWVLSTLVSS